MRPALAVAAISSLVFAAVLGAAGVAVLGTSPYIPPLWQQNIASSVSVALATEEVLVLTSQVAENGGYANTIQALNASSSATLWSFWTFGQVAALSSAFAFPEIPDLVFLLDNNLEPPNVTAVARTTGKVMWSTTGAFPAIPSGYLFLSKDSRTLYLTSTSPFGGNQLTAFDASTGVVLFTNANGVAILNATICGGRGVRFACLVSFNASVSSVTFAYGRTGTLIRTIYLPRYLSAPYSFVEAGEQRLLLSTAYELFAFSTGSYNMAWNQSVSWSSVFTKSYTVGKVSYDAVVLMNTEGVFGLDAISGASLWNATAPTLCPFVAPAPGVASAFNDDIFFLGSFPSGIGGGNLFSFSAACLYYTPNYQQLLIVGALSAVDGSMKWWRYLSSSFSAHPLLPVGPNDFLLRTGSNVVEFYNSSLTIPFGSFPNTAYSYTIRSVSPVGGNVVIFNYYNFYYGYNYVAAVGFQ